MYLSLRGVYMSLSRLCLLTTACAQMHIRGCYFPRGPSTDCCCCIEHRQQWSVSEQGGGSVAIAIIMPGHWRGDALYTKCVGWQLFLLSLLLFFFYPHEVETASHWWTMLLLWWTIKTEKIRAELPSVRQHVYLCWYSCVCVCVSVCMWVCLALFNLEPYIFKVTP